MENTSLEDLIKTFHDHHERFIKSQKDLRKMFEENSPGKPIPDDMTDDFSLPLALATLCNAVLELQKLIEKKEILTSKPPADYPLCTCTATLGIDKNCKKHKRN